MIDRVKKSLGDLYATVLAPDLSRLDFLRALSKYVNYIKSESVLSKLIVSLREEKALESISDIQKSLKDPIYRTLVHAREMVEEEQSFPFDAYDSLEEAEERFSRWSSVKTEEELDKQMVVVKKESEAGTLTGTETGRVLLLYAELVYPKQLQLVHTALLKELDQIKQRGFVSKYFGYDSSKGILYFQEKEVRINNRKIPTNAHYLLMYLFAHDPFYQHFYDELEDDVALQQKRPWKSYYDACVDLQKKVKDSTGIEDFLDFSTGKGLYVRVNSKYSLGSSS